nr:matrix protein [Cytorhabdovirus sp.]
MSSSKNAGELVTKRMTDLKIYYGVILTNLKITINCKDVQDMKDCWGIWIRLAVSSVVNGTDASDKKMLSDLLSWIIQVSNNPRYTSPQEVDDFIYGPGSCKMVLNIPDKKIFRMSHPIQTETRIQGIKESLGTVDSNKKLICTINIMGDLSVGPMEKEKAADLFNKAPYIMMTDPFNYTEAQESQEDLKQKSKVK